MDRHRRRHRRNCTTVESLESRTLFSAGDLDTNFGGAGVVTTDTAVNNAPPSSDSITHTALQADGKILAIGTTADSGQSFSGDVLARYNPDGTLDTSFNAQAPQPGLDFFSTNVPTAAPDVASLPNGQILVAFTQAAGSADVRVVRLNSDGTPDPAFGAAGFASVDLGNDGASDIFVRILPASDGGAFLVGYGTGPSGTQAVVTRIDSAGHPLSTFGQAGSVSIPFFNTNIVLFDAAAQSNGNLLLAGIEQNQSTDQTVGVVFNILPDLGNFNPLFGSDGTLLINPGNSTTTNTILRGISVFPDNRFAVAGVSGAGALYSVRTTTGAPDPNFAPASAGNLIDTAHPVAATSILALPSGDLLATVQGSTFAVALVRPDGTLDTSFQSGGFRNEPVNVLNTLLRQPDGNVVVAGNTSGPASDFLLERLLAPDSGASTGGGGGSPDFTVVTVGAADSAFTAGATTQQITVTAANLGSAAGSAAIIVSLSADSTPGNADDLPIAVIPAAALGANASGDFPATVFVPPTVAAGQYHLVATIDPGNLVAESNETNNTFISPATITVSAASTDNSDLKVTNLSLDKPAYTAGSPVVATVTLQNVGTGPNTGGTPGVFYLLTSPHFSFANAVPIGVGFAPVIQPGDSATATANLLLPVDILPGSYFLGVGRATNTDPSSVSVTPTAVLVVTAPTVKTGSLNPNFGNGGVASTPVTGTPFNTVDSVIQGDGKLVAAGYTTDGQQFVLLRFNPDGSLDTSFGSGGTLRVNLPANANAVAKSLAIQSDGKFVLAGTIAGDFALLRVNPDGTPDATFGANGLVTTDLGASLGAPGSIDTANAVVVARTGQIYLAGSTAAAASAAANTDFAVARYSSTGQLDPTFGTGGVATIDFAGNLDTANDLTIQTDGKILVAGSATAADGASILIATARLLPTGALDPSFGAGGKVTFTARGPDDEIFAVRQAPDGKIVLGGFYSEGSLAGGDFETDLYLARLLPNGQFDKKFGANGQVLNDTRGRFGFQFATVNDLVVTADDKILIAGRTANSLADVANNAFGVVVGRYTATGTLDTTFNNTGLLFLFTPPGTPGAPPSAGAILNPLAPILSFDSLQSQFSNFTTASVGVVSLTPGGGILTLASSADPSTSTTTVNVASITPDGPDLAPVTLVLVKTPASVLGGAKGQATLTLKNSGSLPVKGKVPLRLVLSPDSTLTSADTAVLNSAVSVNLKPGQSKSFKISFSFARGLPDGAYFVVADVDPSDTTRDLNPANNALSARTATTIKAPFVDLHPAFGKLPTTVTAGKKTPIPLTLANNGNIPAKGTARIQLLASSDDQVGDDITLLTFNQKISLKPGSKPSAAKLNLLLKPGQVPAGQDFLYAVVTFSADTNPADNALFSAGPINFT